MMVRASRLGLIGYPFYAMDDFLSCDVGRKQRAMCELKDTKHTMPAGAFGPDYYKPPVFGNQISQERP